MRRRPSSLAAGSALAVSALLIGAVPAQAATIVRTALSGTTLTVTVDRGALEDITVRVTSSAAGYDRAQRYAGILNPPDVVFSATNVVVNGTYAISVSSNITATRNATFDVAVPPAPPRAVTASSATAGVVTVAWDSNSEPDRTGYDIVVDGESVASVTAACSARCVATLNGITPGTRTVAVTAKRRCPTCGSGTISATSAAVEADVRGEVPTAQPSPSTTASPGSTPSPGPGEPTGVPTASPGTSGSPAPGDPTASPSVDASGNPVLPTASPGSGIGGGQVGVVTRPRRGTTSFGGFSGFGSSLAVPGIGTFVPPSVAGERTPDGTFDPQLPLDNEIRETEVAGSSGDDNALGPIGDAVDNEQLMRALAAALVLLLTGAHLRRWLSDPTAAR